MTMTTAHLTASLLWAALEAARDAEAEAYLDLEIAALGARASWALALDAHAAAVADRRRAEAAYWACPRAGEAPLRLLAA